MLCEVAKKINQVCSSLHWAKERFYIIRFPLSVGEVVLLDLDQNNEESRRIHSNVKICDLLSLLLVSIVI